MRDIAEENVAYVKFDRHETVGPFSNPEPHHFEWIDQQVRGR